MAKKPSPSLASKRARKEARHAKATRPRLKGKTAHTIVKDDVPIKKVKSPVVVRPSFPILVFDTETTGLTKNRTVRLDKQPEVIEFYARLIDLDKDILPLKEYYTLIRPSVEFPMSERTIKETKTKISNDELRDAPVFREVAKDIVGVLSGPDIPGTLAHNLSFDRDMIEIELERLKMNIDWPVIGICTVEQTVHLRGRRMNQTALHQMLFNGEDFAGAHRARNDVEALCRIAVELRKRGVI